MFGKDLENYLKKLIAVKISGLVQLRNKSVETARYDKDERRIKKNTHLKRVQSKI